MKILFFSDVHGVPSTLKKLFDRGDALAPDRWVLLGDALYHGPRNGIPDFYDPVETAALLNAKAEKITAVRGNCDSEVDEMMLNFPIRADYTEILLDKRRFFLTHGHLYYPGKLPHLAPESVFVQGHTHIPVLSEAEGITIFNPGSISLPKSGFPRTFGFFDGAKLSVRALDDGDVLLTE
ncbi:MAG: phosphodiesterase [Victivallaceae bacterium]|nr:phosphodiesterase [Victivallaceae bacterium]